jgi:hypothetical protein
MKMSGKGMSNNSKTAKEEAEELEYTSFWHLNATQAL